MAKLKGICKNIDGCDLAADKTEQEAEKSNFVCSECGKPLTQVGGKEPEGNKMLIIIIVAVVLIGGGARAWFGGLFDTTTTTTTTTGDDGDEITPPYPTFSWGKFNGEYNFTDKYYVGTINITSNAQIDINGKAFDVKPKGYIENAKIKEGNIIIYGDYKEPGIVPPPVPKFTWGKYSGPAEGFGGELKVTKEHSIDLGNTRGEILDVYPGDVIKQTKIKNGQLVGGFLIRTDGTRKTFEIGI